MTDSSLPTASRDRPHEFRYVRDDTAAFFKGVAYFLVVVGILALVFGAMDPWDDRNFGAARSLKAFNSALLSGGTMALAGALACGIASKFIGLMAQIEWNTRPR